MPIETHRNKRDPSKNPRQKNEQNSLALLLADTDGATAAASGLGVLTTDTEAPVVTQTAVGADLLQALKVLTELGVEAVGNNLGVLAIGDVALSVKEPGGDLVLGRSLEDGDNALQLFGGELTSTVVKTSSQPCCSEVVRGICPQPLMSVSNSIPYSSSHSSPLASDTQGRVVFSLRVVANVPLVEVDIGLLADQVGVTATDTLDLGQRVHDLLLAVNIGVEQTQDELEVRLLAGHERCYRRSMLADIQFRVPPFLPLFPSLGLLGVVAFVA